LLTLKLVVRCMLVAWGWRMDREVARWRNDVSQSFPAISFFSQEAGHLQ